MRHTSCVETLRTIADPLVTVWPSLVEAMDLLDTWSEQAALWAMVEAAPSALARLDEEDVPRLRDLMEKYRDLPMDLVDASLVHVAERDGYRRVFTVDRRDFDVYRLAGRERFTILPASARLFRSAATVRKARRQAGKG